MIYLLIFPLAGVCAMWALQAFLRALDAIKEAKSQKARDHIGHYLGCQAAAALNCGFGVWMGVGSVTMIQFMVDNLHK